MAQGTGGRYRRRWMDGRQTVLGDGGEPIRRLPQGIAGLATLVRVAGIPGDHRKAIRLLRRHLRARSHSLTYLFVPEEERSSDWIVIA
jgi:hypothetical protein